MTYLGRGRYYNHTTLFLHSPEWVYWGDVYCDDGYSWVDMDVGGCAMDGSAGRCVMGWNTKEDR